MGREMSKSRRIRLPEAIRNAWEVREWSQRDAYGTTTEGVSLYRNGVLIAEGPLDGPPYRRTSRYIPRGLVSDAVRKKFSKARGG